MPVIHLSQGYLNLLSLCPRKFQYSYLQHLDTPANPDQQARVMWGHQFHLLMQQQELGLSIAPLLTDKPQLQASIATLLEHVSQMSDAIATTESIRHAEHCRTLLVQQHGQDYLFTVIYDLLILHAHQAQILDWKTYAQPQQADWLAANWQTRLYRYVLAETSDYSPEQIAMTYWFVQPQAGDRVLPTSLTIPYSTIQHQQTQQELATLLAHLAGWIQQFQDGIDLPQVPESAQLCQTCPYVVRCQRHHDRQLLPADWLAQVLQEEMAA
jgi:hypothetical protein